jgi:glycosyltransferase involved in cell wall biosynthesis
VIATAVGGNPELVAENETGFLIPANDPAALSERLLRYLQSPALLQAHGRAARGRAEREFSLQRMLADYADLYRAMLP